MDPPTETASERLANPPEDRLIALERRVTRLEARVDEVRARNDRIEWTVNQIGRLATILAGKIKEKLS
jgi:hypothetical protein